MKAARAEIWLEPLPPDDLAWYAAKLGGELRPNGSIACDGSVLVYFDRLLPLGCAIACPDEDWQSWHDLVIELMTELTIERAAYEARATSRRYWAKGGHADRAYPVHADVDRMWPLHGRAETAPTKNNKAWITRMVRE